MTGAQLRPPIGVPRADITSWDFPAGSLPIPLIIAHRGDVAQAPENTLEAFNRAWRNGADGVELDVHLTKDDKLVVFHDRRLNRTSDGSGLVNHSTLDEIRSLDVGSWFGPAHKGATAPTLDEVFETLPPGLLINVEMKVVIKSMRFIAHKVAEVVRRHQRYASTLVASFNPVALWELRKVAPEINRGYIWSRYHPYPIRARWFSPLVQAHWYDPANDTFDPTTMRRLRDQGSRTLAWDLDFDGNLANMAAVRLDATVTNSLAKMVQQRQELQQRLT